MAPEAGSVRALIYEALWREAEPIGAPARPSEPCGAACEPLAWERRNLQCPAASLARLGERFPADQLLAAGVALLDQEGELIPAPTLRLQPTEIIALRASCDEPPFDLATARGCPSGAQPAHAMLRDYRIRGRIADSFGYVYLAFSWDDARWLEAAGLPAIYCVDPLELTATLVLELVAALTPLAEPGGGSSESPPTSSATEILGGGNDHDVNGSPARAAEPFDGPLETGDPRTASATANSQLGCESAAAAAQPSPIPQRSAAPQMVEPPKNALPGDGQGPGDHALDAPALVLVNWSPGLGSAEAPPGLAARALELAKVEQSLGYGFPEIIIWSPDPAESERVQLLGRYGDRFRLPQVIAQSVETCGRLLASLTEAAPAQNYIEARAAYHRALDDAAWGSGDDQDLHVARSQYQGFLQRDLVEPLLQRGASLADPAERARYAAAAEICAQLHTLAPLAAAELCDTQVSASLARRGASGTDKARHFLALAKTLAGMLKQ